VPVFSASSSCVKFASTRASFNITPNLKASELASINIQFLNALLTEKNDFEYSGQTEPLNPGQTEPVIPGQTEPLIPVKLSHLRV
jgi:hypothetical protein